MNLFLWWSFLGGVVLHFSFVWSDHFQHHANRTSSLIHLTDGNFEHLTQASTGGTTGNWLILFFLPSCKQSTSLMLQMERLSQELSGMASFGILDVKESPYTLRRFNLTAVPSLRFIRQGKVFTYTGVKNFDLLKSFIINNEYLKHSFEDVPAQFTLYDLILLELSTVISDIKKLATLAPLVTFTLLLIGFLLGLLMHQIISMIIFHLLSCNGKKDLTSSKKMLKSKKKQVNKTDKVELSEHDENHDNDPSRSEASEDESEHEKELQDKQTLSVRKVRTPLSKKSKLGEDMNTTGVRRSTRLRKAS